MPDYDIFVLDESDITISGGAVLDGVTQGNGSHLNGAQITLNNNDWTAISITDNDPNFQDSDGSQRLNGAQEIDGTTYADNTVVEAEYGIVVSDGTNSWTLVGFNVNNSSPAFGTVEGLAFIGGPGGFPPIGVPLTVTSTFEGPNFAATDYATPICLTAGTMILTLHGERPAEEIEIGDMVLTRDAGPQPVRWIGSRTVAALAGFAPVEIAKGVLGNERSLMVSQQHRVLLDDWRAQLISGEKDVLVPAIHLVNSHSIRLRPGGTVTYVHFLFDTHQVIQTNGIWTESLLPGAHAVDALLPAARKELTSLFPELTSSEVDPCYPIMSRREAIVWARI